MPSTSRTTGKTNDDPLKFVHHGNSLYFCSVSLLLDSLQEARNQHRTINGAHVELIDKSLEAHETRLADANMLFYGNVRTVLADKISQFENINRRRNKKEIALRKINLLVSHRGENASNIARSTAISKIHILPANIFQNRVISAWLCLFNTKNIRVSSLNCLI